MVRQGAALPCSHPCQPDTPATPTTQGIYNWLASGYFAYDTAGMTYPDSAFSLALPLAKKLACMYAPARTPHVRQPR
eukprot:363932-Chlamydomonas_euryale.AAC.12